MQKWTVYGSNGMECGTFDWIISTSLADVNRKNKTMTGKSGAMLDAVNRMKSDNLPFDELYKVIDY